MTWSPLLQFFLYIKNDFLLLYSSWLKTEFQYKNSQCNAGNHVHSVIIHRQQNTLVNYIQNQLNLATLLFLYLKFSNFQFMEEGRGNIS